ncbi:methyl-accepting chemotaxis protein [Nitrogeniibacter aestuarii]|uniref:methyl-accepting chemotaxis protein n=1 Tax=Nitrogeniibacter aestuarii TaxID=2815343 RepID=UPI001E42970F|nr:methyl-accepting chemotaxis protein [Nitrogeniibacter aestuarii]
MKSRSIRGRVTRMTVLVVLVVLFLLGWLVGQQMRQAFHEDAFDLARQTAVAEGRKIEQRFGELFALVNAQARYVEAARATGKQSRELTNEMLRATLAADERLFSDYVGFDPDAFDGQDALWAGRPGQDESGRYIPYFSRPDGTVSLSELGPPTGAAWYEAPKRSGGDVVIEPYEIELLGKKTAMITVTTPIMSSDKAIGVVGVDLTLSALNRDLSAVKPFGGTVALISANGVYAAHPSAERVGTAVQDLPAGAMQDIHAGKAYARVDDQGVAQFLQPLALGGSPDRWALMVSFPMAVPLARADETLAWFVAASVCAVLIVSLLVAGALKRHLGPLAGLEASMHALSSGAGDLTATLPVRTDDEIGRIGAAFNRLIQRLKDLVAGVKQDCREVAESAGGLAERASRMAEQARVQTDSASAVVAAMDEVTVAIHAIARTTRETEHAGRNMAAEADGLSGNMQATAVRVQSGRGTAEQLATALDALGRRSNDITGILVVITDIAGQTNLLALNAAIEAARAGEFGRGFAVVADEVRALAERTEVATQDIARLVDAIKDEIGTAVAQVGTLVDEIANGAEMMGVSAQDATDISAGLRTLLTHISDIAAATAEQSASADDVARHVERISHASDEITSDIERNLEEAVGMRDKASRLQSAVAQFRTE